MSNITLHMVASLDGYIAKPDNSVAWFETTCPYPKGTGSFDHEAFDQQADAYIMGANTYRHAYALAKDFGWPYGHKPTIVVSHHQLPQQHAQVWCYSGNLNTLVSNHVQGRFQNVWVVGGAALAKAFLQLKLIHEIRMSILPILLGGGKRFFDEVGHEYPLQLQDVVAFQNGMIELSYRIS